MAGKSLRARIAALEFAAKRAVDDRKLDLFVGALSGDPEAIADFEDLRGAVTGRLHELYDAIRQPLEAEGLWQVREREMSERHRQELRTADKN